MTSWLAAVKNFERVSMLIADSIRPGISSSQRRPASFVYTGASLVQGGPKSKPKIVLNRIKVVLKSYFVKLKK